MNNLLFEFFKETKHRWSMLVPGLIFSENCWHGLAARQKLSSPLHLVLSSPNWSSHFKHLYEHQMYVFAVRLPVAWSLCN